MTPFKDYTIWRHHHSGGDWQQTSYSVKARTNKEAQSKMQRMFSGCGFSSMSMIALLPGTTPNEAELNG